MHDICFVNIFDLLILAIMLKTLKFTSWESVTAGLVIHCQLFEDIFVVNLETLVSIGLIGNDLLELKNPINACSITIYLSLIFH